MLSIFLITFFSHTLFHLFLPYFSRYTFFTIHFHSSFSGYPFFTLFFHYVFHYFFPGTLFSHFFFQIHFFHTFFYYFFSGYTFFTLFSQKHLRCLGSRLVTFAAGEREGVLDGDGSEMGRKERRKEGRKEGREEGREEGRGGANSLRKASVGGSETACWTERKPCK